MESRKKQINYNIGLLTTKLLLNRSYLVKP